MEHNTTLNLNKRLVIRYEWQGVTFTMAMDDRCQVQEIQITGGEKEDQQSATIALADMGWQVVYRTEDDLGNGVIADKTLLMHSVIRPMEISSAVWRELTAALKLSYT